MGKCHESKAGLFWVGGFGRVGDSPIGLGFSSNDRITWWGSLGHGMDWTHEWSGEPQGGGIGCWLPNGTSSAAQRPADWLLQIDLPLAYDSLKVISQI